MYAFSDINELKNGFHNPSDWSKPWVYWMWVDGNVTEDGIKADLEAMRDVSIRGFVLMRVSQFTPVGPVLFGSEEWRPLIKLMVLKSNRLGLKVNVCCVK